MSYKKVSEEIATYLFKTGFANQKATRLLQEMPSGGIGGGYTESAVASTIEKILVSHFRKCKKEQKSK